MNKSLLKSQIAKAILQPALTALAQSGANVAQLQKDFDALDAEDKKHVDNKTQYQGNEYSIHTKKWVAIVEKLLELINKA